MKFFKAVRHDVNTWIPPNDPDNYRERPLGHMCEIPPYLTAVNLVLKNKI